MEEDDSRQNSGQIGKMTLNKLAWHQTLFVMELLISGLYVEMR